MGGIVADASALFDYLVNSDAPAQLAVVIQSQDEPLHVPHLCDAEICSILRRHVLRGELDRQRGEQVLDDYLAMPLIRHPQEGLLREAFSLRENFGAYDAMYVTLAVRLSAKLLTTDGRLSTAIRRHQTVDLALR